MRNVSIVWGSGSKEESLSTHTFTGYTCTDMDALTTASKDYPGWCVTLSLINKVESLVSIYYNLRFRFMEAVETVVFKENRTSNAINSSLNIYSQLKINFSRFLSRLVINFLK